MEAPGPPLWQQVQQLQAQVKQLEITVQQKDDVIASLEQKLEQLPVDREREAFREKCRLAPLEERLRHLEWILGVDSGIDSN